MSTLQRTSGDTTRDHPNQEAFDLMIGKLGVDQRLIDPFLQSPVPGLRSSLVGSKITILSGKIIFHNNVENT